MHGDDTSSHVGVGDAFEAGILDQHSELGLLGEHFDRLDQVLIRVTIVSNSLAHSWNHVERVPIVKLFEAGYDDIAELKTHEATSFSEASVGLTEGFGSIGHISDAESNRVEIKRV